MPSLLVNFNNIVNNLLTYFKNFICDCEIKNLIFLNHNTTAVLLTGDQLKTSTFTADN